MRNEWHVGALGASLLVSATAVFGGLILCGIIATAGCAATDANQQTAENAEGVDQANALPVTAATVDVSTDSAIDLIGSGGDSSESEAAFAERDEAEKGFREDPTTEQDPVSLGTTYRDIDGVLATGELDITLKSATLYASIEEAASRCDVGNVINAEPHGEKSGQQILMLEIEVTSIDAVVRDPLYGMYAGTYFKLSDVTVGSELATFYGAPEGTEGDERLAHRFYLEQGETKTIRVGLWVKNDADWSNVYMVLEKLAPDRPIFDLGLA